MRAYLLPQSWFGVSAFIKRWGVLWLIFAFPLGYYWSLFRAPTDAIQGEVYRLIFLHVPCAFLSLSIYAVIGFLALIYLVWRIKLADMINHSVAIIGFWMSVCALITGSLWGKPTWGTYWIWDARLTSELVLALFYLAFILLRQQPLTQAKRVMSSVILVIGLVNLPIVHFSVNWWNTLHQGSTLLKAKPSISPDMMYPLLWMLVSMCVLVVVIGAYRFDLLFRKSGDRNV